MLQPQIESKVTRREFIKLAAFSVAAFILGSDTALSWLASFTNKGQVGGAIGKKSTQNQVEIGPDLRKESLEKSTYAYNFKGAEGNDVVVRVFRYEQPEMFKRSIESDVVTLTPDEAVIIECQYLANYCTQSDTEKSRLLEAYSDGIMEGLITSKVEVVVLESGHRSTLSKNAMQVIADENGARKKKGVDMMAATEDTGTEYYNKKSGVRTLEKDLNWKVTKLVAEKLVKRNIEVVLHCPEEGYFVDSLSNTDATTKVYVTNKEVELPVVYKSGELSRIYPGHVARVVIHFDSLNANDDHLRPNGAIIYSGISKKSEESRLLAENLSKTMKLNVAANHDYPVKADPDILARQYVIFGTHRDDNPEDVLKGTWENLNGIQNRLIAWVKGNKMGLTTCQNLDAIGKFT